MTQKLYGDTRTIFLVSNGDYVVIRCEGRGIVH